MFCLFFWTLSNPNFSYHVDPSFLLCDAIPGNRFETIFVRNDPPQPCCHNDSVSCKLLISFRSCDGSSVPYLLCECTLPWCTETLQEITISWSVDLLLKLFSFDSHQVGSLPVVSPVHYEFQTLSFLMHEPYPAQTMVPWDKMPRLGEAKNQDLQ